MVLGALVVPQNDIGAQIGQSFGAGLGQGLSRQFDSFRDTKKLKNLSLKWNKETPKDQIITEIMTSDASPEAKQAYLSNLTSLWQIEQRGAETELKKQKLGQIQSLLGIFGEDQQPQAQNNNPLEALTEKRGSYNAAQNAIDQVQDQPQQSQMTQMQQPMQQQQEQVKQPLKSFNQKQILAATMLDPNIGRAMMEQNKFKQKEDLQSRKDISSSYKETKDYRNTLNTSYKAALEDKQVYKRMMELNDKNLASPFQAVLSEHFNIPISILSNPQSEEFEKLVATMTRNVKQYYGARITNLDLEMFLKGIPTLKNSKEGRQLIIETLEKLNKPKELEYKAYQDIKKEYKDKPLPFDLQERVLEKIEPELDNLSKEIKSSIGKDSSKILVISPEGKKYKLPKEHIDEALKAGWRTE
jgi:hypothetical protein